MRIVERGHANEVVAYRLVCDVCETKVNAIEGDPMIGIHRYPRYKHIHWVCPVCKSHVDSSNDPCGAFPYDCEKRFANTEERAEMKSWENLDSYLYYLSKEDLAWIKNIDEEE